MFRIQSELLQGLPWEVFQALTGCGPIYRDVLQGPFEIVGAPLENADPSHAIFQVKNQGNLNIPVAIFGGNVGVTGTLNVANITVDGQDGYTTTVTLNHLTCNEGGIQVTPYTFTFERGVLVGVTIGGTEPSGCQPAPQIGCGLNRGPEDEIVFDAEAVAGSGLVAEESCKIGVDATPDGDLDESLTVVTGATLSLDGCHVTLNQTTRTLTFKHNADGFIIGVELGEPQQSTSTIDVSACCCAESTLYELQKCGVETSIIVAGADLTNPELGSVHRDDNGDCWEVVAVDAEGEPTAFAETASYPPGDDPCGDCQTPPEPTYYELTRCDDPESVILVDGADLTNPELGSVHRDDSGDCWEITSTDVPGPGDPFTETASFPAGGDPCGDCQGPPEPECDNCAGTLLPRNNGSVSMEIIPGLCTEPWAIEILNGATAVYQGEGSAHWIATSPSGFHILELYCNEGQMRMKFTLVGVAAQDQPAMLVGGPENPGCWYAEFHSNLFDADPCIDGTVSVYGVTICLGTCGGGGGGGE